MSTYLTQSILIDLNYLHVWWLVVVRRTELVATSTPNYCSSNSGEYSTAAYAVGIFPSKSIKKLSIYIPYGRYLMNTTNRIESIHWFRVLRQKEITHNSNGINACREMRAVREGGRVRALKTHNNGNNNKTNLLLNGIKLLCAPVGSKSLPLHRLHFGNCSLFNRFNSLHFFNNKQQKKRHHPILIVGILCWWFRSHVLCMCNYFTITSLLLL